MSEIEATWKELLDKISELPEKEQKRILKLLLEQISELEQSSRASGSLDIPLSESKSHGHSLAASFNKGQWAVEELGKALRKYKTIKKAVASLSPEVLAFLPAYAMDIIQRKIRTERLNEVKQNIRKRKEEPYRKQGYTQDMIDFTLEEVPDVERYGIHPNAIAKSLKKMAEEPFYIRKRGAKSFGRGLNMDAPRPKTRKILNLRGELIGEEQA